MLKRVAGSNRFAPGTHSAEFEVGRSRSDLPLALESISGPLRATAGIFVLFVALVTLQLSLPGSLRIFTDEPTTRMVVSFPMVLVPTFIAPMFILIHLLSIKQVFEQGVSSRRRDPV